MKYNILLTLFLAAVYSSAYAQVGINTEKTQDKILYIDSKSNNTSESPTNTEITDDVVVDNQGNLGLGTNNPGAKLHIATPSSGQIKFEKDLTVSDGYVLTSDSNGNGTWRELQNASSAVEFDTDGVSFSITESSYQNTNSYIDLRPGRWILVFNMTLLSTGTESSNIKGLFNISFTDDENAAVLTPSGDIESEIAENKHLTASVYIGRSSSTWQTVFSNKMVINNTSPGVKRYYLIAGEAQYTGSATGTFDNVGAKRDDTSIIALRIK